MENIPWVKMDSLYILQINAINKYLYLNIHIGSNCIIIIIIIIFRMSLFSGMHSWSGFLTYKIQRLPLPEIFATRIEILIHSECQLYTLKFYIGLPMDRSSAILIWLLYFIQPLAFSAFIVPSFCGW